MKINKLKIQNFKSFNELEVDLKAFNVLIGANASGKSNFINIFEFLRDIEINGLDNAISMQGGVEFFQNINIASSKEFSLKVTCESYSEFSFPIQETRDLLDIKAYEVINELSLDFSDRKRYYKILNDKLIFNCEFEQHERKKNQIKGRRWKGEIIAINDKGNLKYEMKIPQEIEFNQNKLFLPYFKGIKLEPNVSLISASFVFFPFKPPNLFEEISIYDFDPKLSKRASPISGKSELEKDGSNLAIVLKNILGDENKKREFSNLIQDTISFIKDLEVEKSADKSLLVRLQESYVKDKYLPAFLSSDGTINITALIIALYFEKKTFIIIEEPERNIHPSLMSRIVNMMKEVSKNKQIIITTHNPEILKYVDLEDILLAYRDRDGFSKITRPSQKKEIRTFLENELGVDELFVQNLLEI